MMARLLSLRPGAALSEHSSGGAILDRHDEDWRSTIQNVNPGFWPVVTRDLNDI
jgi:hypothetical protein